MREAAVCTARDHSSREQDSTLPSLCDAFLRWLASQVSADSIDLLLFVGIAGRKLQRIARDRGAAFPNSAYLPMNSAALALADTDLQTLIDGLPQWASQAHGRTVRAFFDEFGISLPSQKFMHDIGLPDDTVINTSTWGVFARFLYAYRWEVFKFCRENRRTLLKYFVGSGISNGMRIGIADPSSTGQTQVLLSKALDAMFEVRAYAYCFCLPDNVETIALRSMVSTHAMLSPDNYPDSAVQLLFKQQDLLPMLFAGFPQAAPSDLAKALRSAVALPSVAKATQR